MSDKSEESQLLEWAKKGLKTVVQLSESQKISDKFISFNTLLFVFSLTCNITAFLGGAQNQGLSLLFILFFSALIAFASSLGYVPILTAVTNFTSNKIDSLRVSISILYISITFGVASIAYPIDWLQTVSLWLIPIQLFLMPFIGVFLPRQVEDIEINPNQILTSLGHISNMVGIVGFIINIALLYLGSRGA